MTARGSPGAPHAYRQRRARHFGVPHAYLGAPRACLGDTKKRPPRAATRSAVRGCRARPTHGAAYYSKTEQTPSGTDPLPSFLLSPFSFLLSPQSLSSESSLPSPLSSPSAHLVQRTRR